jgi:hemerythrin-like domain-containing protein
MLSGVIFRERLLAKKAKKAKKAAKRKQVAKTKKKQTKPARRKVAARAAATRKRKPEQRRTRLQKAASIARGAALTAVAAITRRLPWPANENDPIELLMTDHRRFEDLLKQGEDSTERARKGRRQLLQALVSELTVHEAIEEQVLYPALEPYPEARKTALEGYEEHHVADGILNELKQLATNDEKWAAKFKVLKENITHHIEEEERMLFPAARGVIEREELLALGARMRALRSELEK